MEKYQNFDDRLREECGVFGVFGHPDAAALTALGLHALQHRGQESAGIVSYDNSYFHAERRMGLVSDNFTDDEIKTELGISDLTETTLGTLKLKDWLQLLRTKDEYKNAKIGQIFRDNDADYEEEAVTDSFFVNDTSDLYLNYDVYNNVGIGTAMPSEKLEVNGNTLIQSNLTTQLNLTINGNSYLNNDLNVVGNSVLEKDLRIDSNLNVIGQTTLQSNLIINDLIV